MVKHRSHSIDFKRRVAQEFISGETLHGLAQGTTCRAEWRHSDWEVPGEMPRRALRRA